jgi:prevent-host-death family protein
VRLISTTALKNRTNEVLRVALAGEPVVVTRHGRPVASLLGLREADLARLALETPFGDRPGGQRPRGVPRLPAGAGPYGYAAFPQPFGPRGPVFARISPTAAAFERDAQRYLGAPVRRAVPPRGLADAVALVIHRHEAFRGPVDLSRLGPFEREVLEALRRIPRGQVRTYREVARQIGAPGAARAVGAACARNPLPLLIPCHRVVRSDGGLGGYSLRGGARLKQHLLRAEGALPARRG